MAATRKRGGSSRSNGRASSTRKAKRNEYEETPDYASAFHRPDNEDPQPRYTGTGELSEDTLKQIAEAGGEFQIAVWVRRAKSGVKYLRIHIEPPYDGGDEDDDEDRDDEDDDDVPF